MPAIDNPLTFIYQNYLPIPVDQVSGMLFSVPLLPKSKELNVGPEGIHSLLWNIVRFPGFQIEPAESTFWT